VGGRREREARLRVIARHGGRGVVPARRVGSRASSSGGKWRARGRPRQRASRRERGQRESELGRCKN
jgi:hypothetical protein